MHFLKKKIVIAASSGVAIVLVLLAGWFYLTRPTIKNLKPVQWVGTVPVAVATTSGTLGPSTLTIHAIPPINAYFRSTSAISTVAVSRAVRFSVTGTYTLAKHKTASEHWKTWGIEAFPVYKGYDFQIWSRPFFGKPKLLGTGKAGKPVNVIWHVEPMSPPKAVKLTSLQR